MSLRPIAYEPDSLITEVDAADFLKLSTRTLQSWRSDRVGPAFIRVGRAIRYRRADLLSWISANIVVPSALNGPGHAG